MMQIQKVVTLQCSSELGNKMSREQSLHCGSQ